MTSIQALFSRVPISLFDLQLIENRFLFSPARLKRGTYPRVAGVVVEQARSPRDRRPRQRNALPQQASSKPPVPNHPHHRPQMISLQIACKSCDRETSPFILLFLRQFGWHVMSVTDDEKKWQKNESFLLNSVSGWENVYHWRTFDILWHFVGFKRRKPEERELLRPGDALYDNYHFIPNTSLTYQKYRVYNISY